MDIYTRKTRWKWYLAIAGLIIVLASMAITRYLTNQLAVEERKKVAQLKAAMESISFETYNEADCDVTFQFEFVRSNTTIPLLLVNDQGEVELAVNFGPSRDTNRVFLQRKLEELMSRGTQPIVVRTPEGEQYLYFEHSRILRLLEWYPVVQLGLIAAFIFIGYLGFSYARRAEQNQVWVGMAKETAHQLGTPISGIVAWIQHLQMLRPQDEELQEVVRELRSDVSRLELIADRFSKIGAAPELQPVNLYDEREKVRTYMARRAPRRVVFDFPDPKAAPPLEVRVNPHLFEWVLENLIRNALDAMDGKGTISARVRADERHVWLDLSDTGKGIPSSLHKTIFRPGFTTKKRGWGLGLSLAKRIVEDYHSGRIFVSKSEPGKGTTFTIRLPR